MGKNEKYFIKDEALKTSDEDYFGHIDLANNIHRMIVHTEAPFNIAIVGKWGMGKSSLINIVKKILSNDPEYLVQEINAWKYQKEEFGKAFLKQLLQSVENKEFTSQQQFEKDLWNHLSEFSPQRNRQSIRKDVKNIPQNILNKLKKHWKKIVFFLITILAVIVYKTIGMQVCFFEEPLEILRQSFLSYCKNVVAILIVPIIVWYGKIYMDRHVEQEKIQLGINLPMETRDDYEIYLRRVLNSQENKNKKIVTIIDDLDRLEMNKIVEALDALKVFMNLDNCIFIVPFDDAILKRALEKNRVKALNSTESVIDSELILDKLFQYKVYIPELVKINIGKYAVDLFRKECSDFVCEYMNDDMDEACRIVQNVIIHKHVTTPRQVKKLINNFVNNMIIAVEREKKGTIQKTFATDTKSVRYIAKMSVLQSDYNEFYDLLYYNIGLMEDLLSVYRGDETQTIPKELQMFFEEKQEAEKPVLKVKYQSLIDYLIYTENYKNISAKESYLYMAQDKISVLTGDRKQQDFISSVLSWNETAVKDALEKTPIIVEKLSDYIRLEDNLDEVMVACFVAINLINEVEEKYKKELILQISARLEVCTLYATVTGIERLDIENYYMIRNLIGEKEVFDRAMSTALKRMEYSEEVENVIQQLLEHRKDFAENVKIQLKQNIETYVSEDEYRIEDIDNITRGMSKDELREYFPIEMFKNLAESLIAEKDYSEAKSNSFARYFQTYINKENVIGDAEQILLDLVADVNSHGVLYDVLNKSQLLRTLPEGVGKELVNEIVAEDVTESSEPTYALLSNLPCVYGEDDDNSILDEFVNNIPSDVEIGNVIENFLENGNDINIFKTTITKITEAIVENSERWELFEKIEQYYDEEQKNEFLSLLDKKLEYVSGSKYGQTLQIIRNLKNNSIWISDIVGLIQDTVYKNVVSTGGNYQVYFSFAADSVSELKEELSQESLDLFARAFLRNHTAFPMETIRVLNNVTNLLGEEAVLFIVKELAISPDKEYIDEIIRFFLVNYKIFTEENDNLKDLVEFIIEYWNLIQDKVQAITILNKCYARISLANLKDLSCKIVEESELVAKVQPIMNKFYECLEDVNFVDLMLVVSKKSSPKEMEYLLLGTKANTNLNNIMVYIGAQADNYTKTQLYEIFRIYEECKCKEISAWIQISRELLKENTNENINKEILGSVIKKVKFEEVSKDKVIDLLFYIYNNTASDELKSEVVKTVSNLKITKKFKSMLQEASKEEFEKIQKSNK